MKCVDSDEMTRLFAGQLTGERAELVRIHAEQCMKCHALSAELAGMGLASVTTSFEAADDVLALIPSPAAVVLQIPRNASWSERQRFVALADRLRSNLEASGIPVILTSGDGQGTHASLLQSELGARILAKPEL